MLVVVWCFFVFFFFKQKTAYEMRISDWSSDVCSSDLTSRRQLLARIGAALVMGFAVVGMHYTGMAAASFPLGAICGAADGLTGAWTAGPIATFALLLSLLIMALAAYDAQIGRAHV